jgi:hypothetical protein
MTRYLTRDRIAILAALAVAAVLLPFRASWSNTNVALLLVVVGVAAIGNRVAGGLERLGARLGLSEALLGLVAALAADTADYGAELRILVIRSGRDCPIVTLADGPMIFPLAIPALARATALLAGPSALPPEPRSRTKRAMTGDLRPLRAALRL